MAPDDHDNHGGHQPPPHPPLPKPLLDDATVTIYLDGLIYTGYNKNAKLFQGGILTAAEEHHVVVDIQLRGENGMKTPVWRLEASHDVIRAQAPFWLYVDSGAGLQKQDFNAQLHSEGDQSIAKILSFEKLHERQMPPNRETFAVFNFPHGTTYSAEFENVTLRTLAQGQLPGQAQFLRKEDISTLTGIDINTNSNGAGKKYIVLANKDGNNEFFRLELQQGKHYEIQILNQPIKHEPGHDPREHFLQFYDLFELRPNEKMFLVDPPPPQPPPPPPEGTAAPASPPHSPPCVSTLGNTEGGLGGG
jgi:hypothetical protein